MVNGHADKREPRADLTDNEVNATVFLHLCCGCLQRRQPANAVDSRRTMCRALGTDVRSGQAGARGSVLAEATDLTCALASWIYREGVGVETLTLGVVAVQGVMCDRSSAAPR